MVIHVLYDNLLEIALTVIFIVASLFLKDLYAFLVYLFAYAGYLLLNRKKIVQQFMAAKQLITRR